MLIKFIEPDFELKDDRGGLIQLVHSGWRQVNYITSGGNAIRGNHYHKNNSEAFYIISGRIKLTLQSLDEKTNEIYNIKDSDFFIIEKNINHIFEFLEPTTLISLYDKGVENYDGSNDIYSLL